MPRLMTLRQAVTIWTLTALAVGCLLLGPRWAEHLLHAEAPTTATRVLAVIASIMTTAPLVLLAIVMVRGADEYHRRLLSTGAALACGGMVVLYPAFYAAQEAGLIAETRFLPYLPTACGLWLVGAAIARLTSSVRT